MSFVTKNIRRLRHGQSLLEIIVALGLTAIMLVTAVSAFLLVVRSNQIATNSRFASVIMNGLADTVTAYSESSWSALYSLSKGSAYHYFLIPSSAGETAVPGEEGVLTNDSVSGLEGEWKLDESSGGSVYDSSGQGNTGSVIGAPARLSGSSCHVGGCMSLNGSTDWLSIPDSPSLDMTGDVTIGMWVKPGSTQNAYTDLLSKHSNGGYVIEQNAGATNQFLFAWDTTGNGGWAGNSVMTTLTPGVWQYFMVVKSGSTVTHYVNGVQTATGSGSGSTITTNNLPLVIGNWSSGGGRSFNGSIDDVRIYNRALSATEAGSLYNSVAYRRYFYVNDVSRDSGGNIQSTYTARLEDTSTQQIVLAAAYPIGGATQTISNSLYLTRWRNQVTDQTDWSGGTGQSGPVTRPNSLFDRVSSGSVDYTTTPGSITSTSASCNADQGTCQFLSSVYDTGAVNGAQYNTIIWQGSQPSGSSVQFKLAASNSPTGPWNYVGAPATPAGPNVQASLDATNFANNRYFKVMTNFTGSSGSMPRIDDIIVDWSY
ncbi:MAG: LamG domain-containing protein [Patescibacteria group bacterium]|nr:LamG domain-containing protein [Patescibacteria group bacterium]